MWALTISKNPEEYPDAKSQPHVQVALKMKAAGKTVRSGDHIQYIICRGAEEGKSAADRAEMPETVKNGGGLYVIDTTWYGICSSTVFFFFFFFSFSKL